MKTQTPTPLGRHRCWELLVLALLILGFGVQQIQAQTDSSCSRERSLRSARTTQSVNVGFANQTGETHTVYWLDFDGKRQKWFDLLGGQTLQQSTFAGHIWLISKANGQCVGIISAPGNFVVRRPPGPTSANRPQQPQKPKTVNAEPCPTISVSSPSEVEEGGVITFTASVRGVSNDLTPSYNWTLSSGIITGGQGTSVITAEPFDDARSITATISVGGLLPNCSKSASSTTGLRPKAQPARKFDEFGTLGTGDLYARLDNYTLQLQNEPMSKGYVITYGGRTSTPTAAKSAGEKARKYLVEVRGIEYSRIVLMDGGYREKPATELWILPFEGSEPPTASPTINPPKRTARKTTTKKK